MTAHAERIRESHRGWRMAEPASRSRLSALATFGLKFERVDDFNVVVAGQYELNLALSFWRAIDGSSQGYLVSALAAEIARNSNPAPGRDSASVELETTDTQQCAESGAGVSSMLPAVWP